MPGAYWTNPSVLQLAGKSDPIDLITNRAREVVLRARENATLKLNYDGTNTRTVVGNLSVMDKQASWLLNNILGIDLIPKFGKLIVSPPEASFEL
jgi:hypothetical protein